MILRGRLSSFRQRAIDATRPTRRERETSCANMTKVLPTRTRVSGHNLRTGLVSRSLSPSFSGDGDSNATEVSIAASPFDL